MIDLHSHVLPGIDDGPADERESVALLEAQAADGVEIVCATPHLRDDYPDVRADELRARCDALQRWSPAVEIVPGGEVSLSWALEASDEELRLASYGQRGTDLLVETPYALLAPSFENLVFGVALRGYRVLLAHPERNETLQRDRDRIARLVAGGTLLQVTAGSLTSRRPRSRARRLATALVKEGLAHVLASDAHRPSGPRGPGLAAGLRVAERLVGRRARRLVEHAPAAILAGERVPR